MFQEIGALGNWPLGSCYRLQLRVVVELGAFGEKGGIVTTTQLYGLVFMTASLVVGLYI